MNVVFIFEADDTAAARGSQVKLNSNFTIVRRTAPRPHTPLTFRSRPVFQLTGRGPSPCNSAPEESSRRRSSRRFERMPQKPVAVVFVHGLARKPAPERLRDLWLEGLARGNPRPDVFAAPNEGLPLSTQGVPTSFSYYADVFYGTDYETDFASYYESDTEADAIAAERLDVVEGALGASAPETPRERAFVRKLEAKLSANLEALPAAAMAAPDGAPASPLEIASWLPAPVKQAIVKKAAMEAFYFLFDKEYERADGQRFKVRSELRRRLLQELAAATRTAEKVVVVAHSMGTMVAYDVLRNCPECPLVDTLLTLGSPLGIR
jgi:pimeloyl-ACP methyl ester carboxylesterase